MRFYRLCCCLCVVTFAVASCSGTALHVGTPSQNANGLASPANSPVNQNNKSDQVVYSLDLQNPEIRQKIVAEGDATKARFVQVEIVTITNPKKHPAQFEVHYQPNGGERILLGAFSLFPPDNPGKFIVPTQGRVKADGALILSLVKSEQTAAGEILKVSIKPMKFVNERQ